MQRFRHKQFYEEKCTLYCPALLNLYSQLLCYIQNWLNPWKTWCKTSRSVTFWVVTHSALLFEATFQSIFHQFYPVPPNSSNDLTNKIFMWNCLIFNINQKWKIQYIDIRGAKTKTKLQSYCLTMLQTDRSRHSVSKNSPHNYRMLWHSFRLVLILLPELVPSLLASKFCLLVSCLHQMRPKKIKCLTHFMGQLAFGFY